MRTFSVTLQATNWPMVTLIIDRGPSFPSLTEVCPYDLAFTKFEVHLKNALQQELQNVIKQQKRS